MAAIKHHWRDIAIQKSEAISDAWEVTKAYAARIAEWVLFGCMIINIIEILPGIHLPPAISNGTLAVQVVSLDIAGFGLASMADHAQRMGNLAAAKRARVTGYALIAIMLVTLVVVTTGILWPQTLGIIIVIEKLLILARVVMTVIYGHVIHSLRANTLARSETTHAPVETVEASPEASPDASQSLMLQQASFNTEQACNNTASPEASPPDDAGQAEQEQAYSNEERIRDYRALHPDASQKTMGEALGLSRSTIQRYDCKPAEATQHQQAFRIVK